MSYYPNDNQYHQQQQWGGTYDSEYNDQYTGTAGNEEFYYDENQQYSYYQQDEHQEYYPAQQSYDEQPYESYDFQGPPADTNALFYPSNPPLVVHNYGYDTQGDPISAIATSSTSETKLMYVASHTSSEQARPMKGSGARKSFRGSRMTVLYENNEELVSSDGGEKRNIYSSFGAHPEGETELLNKLHVQLFGDGVIPANILLGGTHIKPRPTNAFGPPFGPPYLVTNSLMSSMYNPQYTRAEEKHCMGISSILPRGDRVCTVSPYGVRIHTRGGMCVSDKEGLEGRTCGSLIGTDFVLAGGMPTDGNVGRNVHCMDMRRDLKVVSSHTLISDASSSKNICTVADMALNHDRNTIVAGCTDGTIRLLDGERRMVEVAKAKAQRGGVAKVAVFDNLICATGYSSMGVVSPSAPVPYPFPSHVLIYDVRYLGRGGIPHMSTSRSGPRFANFIPPGCLAGMGNGEDPLLLVGSGQTFGGFEIITPFQDGEGTNFFQPDFSPGESMSTVFFENGELTIGTSYGRVLTYGLSNYEKTTHASKNAIGSGLSGSARSFDDEQGGGTIAEKDIRLDMPPFVPPPPELSIDPSVLIDGQKGSNVFDLYIMAANPLVSEEQTQLPSYFSSPNMSSLGPMATKPMVAPSKRWLSKKLIAKGDAGNGTPTYSSNVDLLAPHLDEDKDNERKGIAKPNKQTFPNPNKLLYSQLHSEFYDADVDPRKAMDSRAESEDVGEADGTNNEECGIPARYRALVHPPFYKMASFDFALYNNTEMWVGWDYNLSWSNSWANPVLTLLYFMKEIRSNALELQLHHSDAIPKQAIKSPRSIVSVISELGLLFNLIEQLPVNSMINPDATVKPFVASNFISAFTLLPEAANLALLDVGESDISRKPEALYRFLVQYLDKELVQLGKGNVIDRLQGIDFVSLIEYSHSGKSQPTISSNHSCTLDLSYDPKWSYTKLDRPIRFSDVLRFSLCKATPLRAYNEMTRSYETVTQRKIATSLPSLLALSCCCAGATDSGLQFWQNDSITNFLPERIEIQIEADGGISVVELATVDSDGNEEWMASNRKLNNALPPSLTKTLSFNHQKLPVKKSYELHAVISFVRGKTRTHDDYHVVHVKAPRSIAKQTLLRQLQKIDECILEKERCDKEQQMSVVAGITLEAMNQITLVTDIALESLTARKEQVLKKLASLEDQSEEDWLLINGLKVTRTTSDDARSFCGSLKEPSIIIFREVENQNEVEVVKESLVPIDVMDTVSYSNGCGPLCSSTEALPEKGDLVAIDCEFVCVQAEKSHLSASGAKNIISESRNALARLSVINCKTGQVMIDDYVLPNEPVVDCLTRFSGVRDVDLDPNNSPHHLVSTRAGYLKVRLLMERGCIFVGHGLNQDFRVLNISIPPNQIIDTAEIYHQPNQRYISLRYLANYVLGSDMQQEVHDSVEDAKAAYDLYQKALSLKREEKFDEFLVTLYAEGHKSQFKLIN